VIDACVGQPLSWLALERHALDELPGPAASTVREHLGACAACRAALERITRDQRALPALPALAPPAPVRWWRRPQLWAGAGMLAAAAILLLVFVRRPDSAGGGELTRAVRVKGAGVVALRLVRERDGSVAFDPAGVRDTDRWKLQLTCAPGGAAWVDVAVYQRGAAPQFPLPPHRLACANNLVLPGAFRITGGGATICAHITPDAPAAPDRARFPARPSRAMACATVAP
jgi:hypothetical protein